MSTNNTSKPLSNQFQRAYYTSCRASPLDVDPGVREARKNLKSLRGKMEKKLRDVTEICAAASVVTPLHPQMGVVRDRSCTLVQKVRRDLWLLNKELKRLKK